MTGHPKLFGAFLELSHGPVVLGARLAAESWPPSLARRVLGVAASGYLLVTMISLVGGRTARHPIMGDKITNAMT